MLRNNEEYEKRVSDQNGEALIIRSPWVSISIDHRLETYGNHMRELGFPLRLEAPLSLSLLTR